jgi:hypothetical protein
VILLPLLVLSLHGQARERAVRFAAEYRACWADLTRNRSNTARSKGWCRLRRILMEGSREARVLRADYKAGRAARSHPRQTEDRLSPNHRVSRTPTVLVSQALPPNTPQSVAGSVSVDRGPLPWSRLLRPTCPPRSQPVFRLHYCSLLARPPENALGYPSQSDVFP